MHEQETENEEGVAFGGGSLFLAILLAPYRNHTVTEMVKLSIKC